MTEPASITLVGADDKRYYQLPMVWPVIGIAWVTMTYAYTGSIIGTTLGEWRYTSKRNILLTSC